MSSVDVDDNRQRQEILHKTKEIHQAIFAHVPGRKLDSETRRFIAAIAAIATALGCEWTEWIDYSVQATMAARARIPGAYLRNTLRKSLVEFAGICESDAEAAMTMGKLLAAARPLAKSLFAQPQESPKARAGT